MDDNENEQSKEPKMDTAAYEVGYGKPPKSSQFTKGHSGNPSGRPKKKRAFQEEFVKALDRKVAVTLDGKTVMMTRRQVAAEQWATKFAKGNADGFRVAMELDPHFKAAPEEKNQYLRFTLKLEENDPGPHWQLIEDGEVISEG